MNREGERGKVREEVQFVDFSSKHSDFLNPQSHSSLVKFSQASVSIEIPPVVENYYYFHLKTQAEWVGTGRN